MKHRKIALAAAGLGAVVVGRTIWRRLRRIDLRGKVVLITGSSRGLGFAMAREFANHGARLVICARDQYELDLASQALEAQGAEVLAVRCDVAQQGEVEGMIRKALERFGTVDVLVNNAGIISVGPLEVQRREDFEEAMAVIFWGSVNPTLALLPHMRERGRGHIVNITSIGGRVSVPHLLPYNCAKFAVVGFSEGLRAELAKDGVRVTTVVPGLMRTGSYMNAFFKGKHRAEYTWFSLSSTSPLTTMSAQRAARAVVDAVRDHDSEVVLTPQAKLLSLFHGMFPGLTTDILALVNRLLPGPGGVREAKLRGYESETPVTRSFLTKLGREAARDLNQQTA